MYKKVLVPVTLDHTRDFSAALNVARLVADADSPITVLHVIEDLPSYVDSYLPKDHRASRQSEAEVDLKAELGGVKNVKSVVVYGHSGNTIVDYATAHDFDCIVISSHRPGLQDYFLGSTAARVVRHALCAVHVIR